MAVEIAEHTENVTIYWSQNIKIFDLLIFRLKKSQRSISDSIFFRSPHRMVFLIFQSDLIMNAVAEKSEPQPLSISRWPVVAIESDCGPPRVTYYFD